MVETHGHRRVRRLQLRPSIRSLSLRNLWLPSRVRRKSPPARSLSRPQARPAARP
jgi:hypothetical protein